MLNHNFMLRSTTVLIAFVFAFFSCTQQDEVTPAANGISDEVTGQFAELGFDVSDIQTVNETHPLTGEKMEGYLLEGDIMITKSLLKEMLGSDIAHKGVCGEQYRTNNLVSSPQTIEVIGYTGGSQALNGTMQTALTRAVANYNALDIGLTFTLTFGTNYSPYDIVVYRTPSSYAGGSAGFPSGGAPYKFVQILGGTSSYGTNVTEHVITHEIGHCVGLRHTDYFNRSLSCGGEPINEGPAGVGAVLIPGTPSGFDANSVMLSCFSSSESGNFGANDVEALEYLY